MMGIFQHSEATCGRYPGQQPCVKYVCGMQAGRQKQSAASASLSGAQYSDTGGASGALPSLGFH